MNPKTTPPTSVNFPPVEVHFCLVSGTTVASNSMRGFPSVKAARKWLRSQGLSIKSADRIWTREEPIPFYPTTVIEFHTNVGDPK